MLIGIISDSHDNLPKIESAVAKLNSLRVGLVLHAGDYCSPFAALRFRGLQSKMIGVLGNNDAEKELLKTKFETLGHELRGRYSSVELKGVRIGLIHRDEPTLLDDIIRSQAYDLVVSGHTHSVIQARSGKTTSLNPGEVCSCLTSKATIATFDTLKRQI